MRHIILLFFAVLTSTGLMATTIQGESGLLLYSDGVDGDYKSLVYKTNTGRVLRIFDEGLSYNYNSKYDAGNLSPDKAYSVVHFSEVGEEYEGRSNTIYLCAFVRMSDGCVVNVSTGEQCGGGWGTSSLWRSSLSINGYDLTKDSPTVDKVYKDYASGRKDLIQVSSPRVLAYFLEGTTFDNILACDPPREKNKKIYSDMLTLLERDGDASNSLKLRAIMGATGMLPTGETVQAAQPAIKVESRRPLALSVFDHGTKYGLLVPGDFLREIEAVYDDVHIEDITGDGVGEVVFHLAGDGVNFCSRVLRYESSDHSLKELVFNQGGLCDFKLRGGYIISSYKDGGTWVEDIYIAEGGQVNIKMSDRCVGCGEVSRVVYPFAGSPIRSLVSDDMNFEKRTELVSTVESIQARIFSSPAATKSTQKYLIRGDRITFLGFYSNDGEDWVEFRFSGGVTTEGWLRCSDLVSCDKF
ncbi:MULTISPECIES: hypothetical protein [unclassified Pseudomonas]|uniref:hypothetical protein n=1 Tax=unclassified Pseudomonas TaxID=196821 RepID=UPI0011AEE074|nr:MULTISPECIES: hypothetical protein [unclassified Pseudomonas]